MIELSNEDNMALMARYPDKHFELAIVDPPYGIGSPNHEKKTAALYRGKKWNNSISSEDYFKELFRVSKHQIIWGANYYTCYLPVKMGWIAWDKKIPGNPNGFSKIELAWTSFKMGDDLISDRVYQLNKIHPTQKPDSLYRWLLHKYAKPGDKILDTHLGSGSIAIACHDMGFDLTAREIDKDYFEAAVKRYILHKGQQQLFSA